MEKTETWRWDPTKGTVTCPKGHSVKDEKPMFDRLFCLECNPRPVSETDLLVRVVGALVGMVCENLNSHDEGSLEEDYGIKPPHLEYVSVHLGFHAEALRILGDLGIMRIDDRGGRCVMGEFVKDDLLNFSGLIPGWEDTPTGKGHIYALRQETGATSLQKGGPDADAT